MVIDVNGGHGGRGEGVRTVGMYVYVLSDGPVSDGGPLVLVPHGGVLAQIRKLQLSVFAVGPYYLPYMHTSTVFPLIRDASFNGLDLTPGQEPGAGDGHADPNIDNAN